jgi:hypothetical protein
MSEEDSAFILEKPDFPDWLSPMLVKELRQGMRSRVFLLSFLALQVAMIFMAILGLMNAAEDNSNEGVSVFYWIVICLPLLFIMPSSGLGVISREKMANTLEPILLTRLTARRILIGKWVAIMGQTLLLVAAILPYTVLRYYLGGVNLVVELEVLAWVVLSSAALTAVAVGVSPWFGRISRVLVPIVLFVFVYVLAGILFDMANTGGPATRGGPFTEWWMVPVILVQTFLLGLFMLESGAGQIAPGAENHTTTKRLIALASVLIVIACSYASHGYAWNIPLLVIAVPAMVGAVCDSTRSMPSIYRPFVRRGLLGRFFGRVFYPGWPAGVLYSLLLMAIVGFRFEQMLAASYGRYPHDHFARLIFDDAVSVARITELSVAGALFLPMAVYRLLKIRKISAIVFFFCFHLVFSVLDLFGALVASIGRSNAVVLEALSVIPTCALWNRRVIGDWDAGARSSILLAQCVLAFLSILILIVRMIPVWRAISALEKTAAGRAPAPAPSDAVRPAEPA